MKKRYLDGCILLVALLAFSACAAPPQSFETTVNPAWRTIEVNEDLEFDDAWHGVTDLVLKKGFEFAQLDKLNGYAMTHWSYTWTGKKREDYRVKLTLKFTGKAKDKLEIKASAEFGGEGRWEHGTDHALLNQFYTEIGGKIGRSAR